MKKREPSPGLRSPDIGLLDNFSDAPGSAGPPTFTNGETLPLLHRQRRDQLHVHTDVVAGHEHLDALRQGHISSHVTGAEIELRTVLVKKWRMASTFFFRQD